MWLAARERARQSKALGAEMVRTDRNGPICQVLEDLRFQTLGENNGRVLMLLPLQGVEGASTIMEVKADEELRASLHI
jgi:hypothetical protein